MNSNAARGLIQFRSRYTHAETLNNLQRILREKGISIFCLVDHKEEATKVGLSMNPAVLLIFGNPEAGTPLMVESPTLALDLPLKALVWQDETGVVWVTGSSTDYLRQRHGLKSNVSAFAAVEKLLETAAGD